MTQKRCDWCTGNDLYEQYHDNEWGVPVREDKKHFEFLLLECMQAGLSWITILKKRENFRKAFDNFDFAKIAKYDEIKVKELLSNRGIIRNEKKIRAAINNAGCFIDIQEEFGTFDYYIWGFVDGKPVQNNWRTLDEVPANSKLSDKISNDLKKRGFKFVGSTTLYAHLQATGIINDHLITCFRNKELMDQ